LWRPLQSRRARLTKPEIAAARATLEIWQRPGDLLKKARRLMRIMGNEPLFNQAGVRFITEAWGAAQFARARSALAARLVATQDRFPDFELRTRSGRVEQWEFTEVDKPWRRRGAEMRRMEERRKAGKRFGRGTSMQALARHASQVPMWIRRRCRAKTLKRYGGQAGLLVYLNWSDFSGSPEIEEALAAATAPSRTAFSQSAFSGKPASMRLGGTDGRPPEYLRPEELKIACQWSKRSGRALNR
jgi:hypothetical protein